MEGDGINKAESGHKGFPAGQDCHSFACFSFLKIKTLAPGGVMFWCRGGDYVLEIAFDFSLLAAAGRARRFTPWNFI